MPGYQFCPAYQDILSSHMDRAFRVPFWKQCSMLKFSAKSHRTCWTRPSIEGKAVLRALGCILWDWLSIVLTCKKFLNLLLLLIQKVGNDPYFIICLHFCIAIILASKQNPSRRYCPTKNKTDKLRKSDSRLNLSSMRYTWLVKLITSIWQMGGRSSQGRQITYYLFQRILKVNQIPTVIMRCCDSWVILLQGAPAVSTAAGGPDTSI